MTSSGLSPESLYKAAFLNPAHYRSAQMAVERQKEAETLLASVISSEQPWQIMGYAPFQRQGMNTITRKLV
jgi:hypothetical protein